MNRCFAALKNIGEAFVSNSCILSEIAIGRRPNVFYYFFYLKNIQIIQIKNLFSKIEKIQTNEPSINFINHNLHN